MTSLLAYLLRRLTAPTAALPMGAVLTYLLEHPPARVQFRRDAKGRPTRRTRPTGCTIVHTAENMLATIDPDIGAEATADFIRRCAEPGSFHDLVDIDSALQLLPYEAEAYQDGTGSNRWAMSINFRVEEQRLGPAVPPAPRRVLRQGAGRSPPQQQWFRGRGYPTTPLRRISRAQSEQGLAGFISHPGPAGGSR